MNGVVVWPTVRSAPVDEKCVPLPPPAGSVPGSAYLDPNPLPGVHGYVCVNGESVDAIDSSVVLRKAAPLPPFPVPPCPPGKVPGLVYFVPKPEPWVKGYVVTKGVLLCAVA